ncbi:hypothetical protein LDENG_00058360, partial [Lucifuga dentata]
IPSVQFGSFLIKSCCRNLGILFDQHLNQYIKSLSRNCFYQLCNISKLRSVVPHSVFETIIHVIISSRLDCCNCLFTCLNKTLLGKLQLVQNTAARLLCQLQNIIFPVLLFTLATSEIQD